MHKQKVQFENHPLFKSGEEYILFLKYDPDETKYVVSALGYGIYKIGGGM